MFIFFISNDDWFFDRASNLSISASKTSLTFINTKIKLKNKEFIDEDKIFNDFDSYCRFTL